MSPDQAMALAEAEVMKVGIACGDDLALVSEQTLEFAEGWVFFYNTREYIETGNSSFPTCRKRSHICRSDRVCSSPSDCYSLGRRACAISKVLDLDLANSSQSKVPSNSYCVENGSRSSTPVDSISVMLRVTRIKPWTLAVAARRLSMSGSGLGIPRRVQVSAMVSSIGRTRSASRLLICESHRSRDFAWSGSLRLFSSMPRRISARTRTLVPMSSTESD